MSYDLFFRKAAAAITPEEFEAYFRARPNYNVDMPQAVYTNETTGVYFVFELSRGSKCNDSEEGADYVATFNLNYYRPSFFILEAEPEVTAFVGHFGLAVSDPQMHGMGEGKYDAELFVQGWRHGNTFGYSAMLADAKNRTHIMHLPADVLNRSWAWNYGKKALQAEPGEFTFVPSIMFVNIDGKTFTAAVWPDGIPIAVPDVDFFIVTRKALAPRKWFRRMEDRTIVAFDAARPVLESHWSRRNAQYVLDYDIPPDSVAAFVRGLPTVQSAVTGLAYDRVLDRELVEKALLA